MVKRILKMPMVGAMGAIVSILWEGYWLVGPPLGIVRAERPWYLFWGLIALLICGVQAFLTLKSRISELEKELSETKKQIYDGRPLFVLEVVSRLHWRNEAPQSPIFRLRNCGNRPARFVQLDSVPSSEGNYRLKFADLPVLRANEDCLIDSWVSDRTGDINNRIWLWEFLDDHTPNLVVEWWDIKISFRDTDESVGSDLVRLMFDIVSEQLVVRAVPYTERGFKPIA